ncbi:MAG: hypothetical protein EA401_09515 [Planctomycetota bacterium]|nr:MAG: hypothetical protein EA401_09515 [Planctomycetota bacterium]
MHTPPPPLRIGASYYPEHWPRPRWHEDLQLMKEADLDVLRVGEFAWAALQPGPEHWDWEWLDQFMDDAHEHGIQILLCTPSACPPPWLIDLEPDILPQMADGSIKSLGARRHYSPFHAAYRDRAAAMAAQLGQRYGQHPALMGWQIDNELCGNITDCGPLAQAAFQQWLRQRFNDHLDDFCTALGLHFWSQRYSSWDQIPLPIQGSHHPGLKLLFQECCSDYWIAFCAAQVQAIREQNCPQPITTNCYAFNFGMAIDWRQLVEEAPLDCFSFDNYARSAHEACFYHDLGSSMGVPYWITEQQSGPYGANYPWPEDPLRVTTMATNGREHGAEAILYFPWRQIPWGQEQEHGAILDHNGKPGLQFHRVCSTNAQLRNCKPLPPQGIGLAFCWRDSWAWQHAGLKISYAEEMIERCYRGLLGVTPRVEICTHPDDLARLRIAIIPLKCVYDAAWEAAIIRLVVSGGQVLCCAHTFARDAYNAYRSQYLGRTMEDLFGIQVNRRIRIRNDAAITCDDGLRMHMVAEILDVDDAEIITRYSDGPQPHSAALTRKDHASGGAAWYCAGYPDHHGFTALVQRVTTHVGNADVSQ